MSNIIEGITKDLKAIPKNLKAKAGGMDTKKLVLLNLPYIFAGYFCDKPPWICTHPGDQQSVVRSWNTASKRYPVLIPVSFEVLSFIFS